MRILLDENVYDAALGRIRFIFREFEEVIVSHSGGKDSTVTFQLALIAAREQNRLPLKVQFIDQEAEWTTTIEHMREVMTHPEVEPIWLQVPIRLFNAVSTEQEWLYCWEVGKDDEWIRPKESYSLHDNIYGVDRFKALFKAYVHTLYPQDMKVAYLAGVRTEESPGRFLACTSANTYKHLTFGHVFNTKRTFCTFYPIYDWSWTDVWYAIHSNKWPYNHHYDQLYMYGEPLHTMRVSNVHHETAVRSLFHLQEIDPPLYNALTKRLPGIDMAGKVGSTEFYVKKLPYMFASWKEYRDYLLEKLIHDEHQETFKRKFAQTEEVYEGTRFFDGLMSEHIRAILTNDYHFTKLANYMVRPGYSRKHMVEDQRRLDEREEIRRKIRAEDKAAKTETETAA